jgi:predicted membrane protein
MRNSGVLFLGILLIFFGGLALVSQFFHIDFGTICWPVGLILVGLFMLLRPRLIPAGTNLDFRLLGDAKRRGTWTVQNEEFWSFVGDTRLDMSEAEIPAGETKLRVYGFVGDVRLRLPQDVGFCVNSVAFLSETRILGDKQDTFVAPFEFKTPGYETAERKIRLESWFFVANIRAEQSEAPKAAAENTAVNS